MNKPQPTEILNQIREMRGTLAHFEADYFEVCAQQARQRAKALGVPRRVRAQREEKATA